MRWRDYLSDPDLRDFVPLESGPVRALVRRGCEAWAPVLGVEGSPEGVASVGGGRAAHPLVELPGGDRALVRAYRRGGLVARVTRDRYLAGSRAFEELRVTEHARARGVRVPEGLAAAQRRERIGYRAWLATRWVEGAAPLVEWLGRGGSVEGVLRATGAQIAAMHEAGIAHPDLNLHNLLVAGGDEVYLLDFDRAVLLPHPAPRRRRARDLRRLARSARKLGASVGARGWAALREGYGAGWPLRADLG